MATAIGATQLAPSCSEQDLVAAVRRGEDRAFETLYGRYRARIGAYIQGMLHDHARAEDIAQEVFISALRRLRDTERPIAFKPWLYEIAKNACIDEFRRTRRTREVPLETDHDDVDGSSGPVIAGGTTPDSAVENKQRLNDLRGAFHGLSESHHRIIVMREFEGLSYDQIGVQLGMSKPVVESTLFRARRKLSQEYDELVSGRRCERVQSVIEAGGERPLLSLGVRERRQLARHLSHCQPCRRHARMAGVDESFFQTPGIIGKIAALLPIPGWLRWRRSKGDGDAGAAGGLHSIAALPSVQVAARLADPATPTYGLGRATATAAAIVIAGAGGGLVTGLGGHGTLPAIRPAHGHVAAPAARTPSASSTRTSRAGSSGVRKANLRRTFGGGSGGSPARRGAGSGGSGGSAAGHGGAARSPAAPSGSGGSGSPLSPVTSRIKSVVGGAGAAVGGVKAPIGGTVSKVTQTASGVTNGAANTVNQTVSNVSNTASNVTNTASNTVSQTASNVSNTASNVTNTASNTVSQTASNVSNTASNVTNTASNTLNQTVSNVTQSASNTVNSLPKPQLPAPPSTGGLIPGH